MKLNTVQIGTPMRIVICTLLVWFAAYTAAQASEPSETARHYFSALQTGNMNTVLTYMGGTLLKKTQAMLVADPNYGDSLRHRFQAAEIEILDQRLLSENSELVKVRINYSADAWAIFIWIFQQDDSATWRIVKEIADSRH